MDIHLKYPFEDVNVTVDCGGQRVDCPKVHIAVSNGEIDANKSAITTLGTIHLHPFRAMLGSIPKAGDSEEDNMAAGFILGCLRACAAYERAGGRDDAADRFDEFAADHTFCVGAGLEFIKSIPD